MNKQRAAAMPTALLSLLLLMLISVTGRAASGAEGVSFLEIPVGAGPSAMGGAYTALATDAYAPVYNPAGLAWVDGFQAAAQHLSYLQRAHFEHISIAVPLTDQQGFGLTAQYIGSGASDRTDENGIKAGIFSNYYGLFGLSYAVRPGGPVSYGATGKVIHGNLDASKATAYAMDFGAQCRANEWLDLGAVLANFGSDIKFFDQKDPLPTAGKLGIAVRPFTDLLLTADGVYERVGPASLRGGIELKVAGFMALRAGYRTDVHRESTAGFTAGVGMKLFKQEISYAWLPYGDLGSTNYFSLLWRFEAAANYSPAAPES